MEIRDLRVVLQSSDKELIAIKTELSQSQSEQQRETGQLSSSLMSTQLQLDKVQWAREGFISQLLLWPLPSVAVPFPHCLFSSRPKGWSGSSSWSIIGICRTRLTSCKRKQSLRLIRPNRSYRTGSRKLMTWKLSSRSVNLTCNLWFTDASIFFLSTHSLN